MKGESNRPEAGGVRSALGTIPQIDGTKDIVPLGVLSDEDLRRLSEWHSSTADRAQLLAAAANRGWGFGVPTAVLAEALKNVPNSHWKNGHSDASLLNQRNALVERVLRLEAALGLGEEEPS